MRYHEKELLELKALIADMSAKVTQMIKQSISALINKDSLLAKEVINGDRKVDQLDIEIDELCMKVLALYEPKAIDLRYIMTASRIIVDLERIGDYCVNISKEVIKLNDHRPVKQYNDLPLMGEIATTMIRDSVNAYFNRNCDFAKEVIYRDDQVDHLNNQIITELMSMASEDRSNLQGIISLMFIARSLERIADHATSIAELVCFMVTGKIIRHAQPGELEG